jgi:hypothetical protein
MSEEYDWRIDAYHSWLLAIAELHRLGVEAGVIPAHDDADDQAWLDRMRSKADV